MMGALPPENFAVWSPRTNKDTTTIGTRRNPYRYDEITISATQRIGLGLYLGSRACRGEILRPRQSTSGSCRTKLRINTDEHGISLFPVCIRGVPPPPVAENPVLVIDWSG